MTMITPSYLGETIEYSSLHACRSTLEDPKTSTAQKSSQTTDRASALSENGRSELAKSDSVFINS